MATVLLADSASDQRQMYAEYLRHAGYDSIECDSGLDALARTDEADVIVTAVRVDGPLDGIDIIRWIRRGAAGVQKPIIVLLAWAGDRARAEAAGCDRALLTPCLPDVLADEVRRALDMTSRRRVGALSRES